MFQKFTKYFFITYLVLGMSVVFLYLILPTKISQEFTGCTVSLEQFQFFECQNFAGALLVSGVLQYASLAFLSPILLLVIGGGAFTEFGNISMMLLGVTLILGGILLVLLICFFPFSIVKKYKHTRQTRR